MKQEFKSFYDEEVDILYIAKEGEENELWKFTLVLILNSIKIIK